ncbi:MAG: thioredoxin domain-containing protein [bacterium]|nr:thioredoxin domain-containing protein [bacterium]
MNRLAGEKSPYLLQHAHNPVDWYPWGPEALEKARREDRPIFLSIGYAACHWCHVMERESFEDEEVAAILNRHYVPVKVDREERPDLDHVYMTACQALTGQGGWPLTVILDPDHRPFFAGTYFPKRSKWGKPGLLDLLERVAKLWREDREGLLEAGERITALLQTHLSRTTGGQITADVIPKAYRRLESQFDPEYGGFGRAPKFPTPSNLTFLLRYHRQAGEARALAMVETTLRAMRQGGIWDHVGFGFARYSTDRQWLVPHFEKMLYDNALLATVYLEAYQVTGDREYAGVARDIFTYVLRDMTGPEGGFYSSEDADSEGEEGKFYLWTPAEVRQVLGEELAHLYCRFLDITEAGNFEGKNIPNRLRSPWQPGGDIAGVLEGARARLLEARSRRERPLKDDKVLTGWNALMVVALARGHRVLKDPSYARAAERALDFIETRLRRADGRLLARYRDGEAAFPAYLDDHAFLTWALLEMYEAVFDPAYLERALQVNQDTLELFGDDNGGLFFYGQDAETLIARPKELQDGALPAGNSVAALNLYRLARLTGREDLKEAADRQLEAFAGQVAEIPAASPHFLMALQFSLGPPMEVAVAGKGGAPDTKRLLDVLQRAFLPNAVLVLVPDGPGRAKLETLAPFVKDLRPRDGQPAAYVCEDYACRAPVTEPAELARVLGGPSA